MSVDYFGQDTVGTLYNEEKTLENAILEEARNLRACGDELSTAKADYDALKHQELLHLYVEESNAPTLKRTEKMREAIYRTKFAAERLKWVMAERKYKTSLDYLDSLKSVLISTQSRMKIFLLTQSLDGN